MAEQRFTGKVEKFGSKTFIALPFHPDEVWGSKDRHYISGSVDGCRIRGPLGIDGAQYFIPLGPAWLRDHPLETGVVVEVVLTPEGPQADLLAADIAEALAGDPQARAFFDSLATFYRKNYLRWIESAKRPETRAARIAEMMQLLREGKKQR